MENTTKKYKKKYKFLSLLSFLLLFGPLFGYVIAAFINGEPHQKFCLGITIITALILVLINVIMKISLRSTK